MFCLQLFVYCAMFQYVILLCFLHCQLATQVRAYFLITTARQGAKHPKTHIPSLTSRTNLRISTIPPHVREPNAARRTFRP